MQVEHKASHGQPHNSLEYVFQHMLLGISIHGYVIQVDDYGQRVAAQDTAKNTVYNELEMGRHLCLTH